MTQALPTPRPEGRLEFCSICGLDWRRHSTGTAEDCIALLAERGHDPADARRFILADHALRERLRADVFKRRHCK